MAQAVKKLRCRAVRILFQEVVFHRPDLVKAQCIGQLHLLQGVVVYGAL
jgi:hypothetical protein